ncbi:hypothetical protein [Pseudomonas congelans]|uniref:hypothetical protein n=1 Tax=Pseudomonas congelans TaxID=200452 RepID=UPI0004E2944D|nr:hypothetical protein [Pseudomonas congelans]KFE46438.1 hypothetical protein IV03_11805 [Pseudomonas congelans]
MSYQYGQEARERISAFGQHKIAEFIEEVPHDYRKGYCDRQPAISGFRRGSPPEFKEKQRRLIGHIVHPQGGQKGDADWKTFANFWVAWAKHRLGVEFPPGDSSTPENDAGPIFLEMIAGKFPDAPREVVERLIAFSCFPDHSDTQTALERFRPASTLARDRMIDALPGRLDKIEGYFEIAETAAEEVAEQFELLESKVSVLADSVDDVKAWIQRSTSDADDLRSRVDEAYKRTEQLIQTVQALDEMGRNTSEALAASDEKTELIGQKMSALSVRAEAWDQTSDQVSDLKALVEQIKSQAQEWGKTAEAVGVLSDRIEDLQANLDQLGTGPGLRSPQYRLLEIDALGPLVEIHSVENAQDLISCNLQACGIVKGAAISTARLILAGLAAGQLVQFSGSLADFIADAVAAAIGGPTFHEWRVPVGLMSEEAASDCLEAVADNSGCLVLKGANRSAFEIYGNAIRDIVIRRQLSVATHHKLALVCSWVQGPAAFPDGGTLAELGPVFDTDSLPLRGVSSRTPILKYGHLARNTWQLIDGFDDETPSTLITDLRELLAESGFRPGNLWTRSADRAYLQLRATPGGNEDGDLHAILTYWAGPWARASGGPFDAVATIAERIVVQRQAESSHFEGV